MKYIGFIYMTFFSQKSAKRGEGTGLGTLSQRGLYFPQNKKHTEHYSYSDLNSLLLSAFPIGCHLACARKGAFTKKVYRLLSVLVCIPHIGTTASP